MSKSEQRALELYPKKEKHNKKGTGTYDSNYPRRKAYLRGYDEALVNHSRRVLWKDAEGEELPEIDREVVVFTEDFPNDAGLMSVAIGHRPDPNGWDGKSLLTGKVEHFTAETYGKGGWNIPNVKYWLDLDLPIKEDKDV